MGLQLPPSSTPDREQAIRDYVKAGNYEVTWAKITSDHNGRHAEFQVFGDSLKIEGVRVNVSAETQQILADMLGCSLLTPHLLDLMWLQRDGTLKPHPRPITSSTQAMLDHSADIDKDLANFSAPPSLLMTTGKNWTISNGLLAHPGKAENYGWHFEGVLPGIPSEAGVTPSVRLIQGQGWAHDMHHVDYSQICMLVSRKCTVDGQEMDIQAVLTDPYLAPLANHDGVLQVLRQPGVPDPNDDNPY